MERLGEALCALQQQQQQQLKAEEALTAFQS
jgi:hypothetical protein